nr:MAG: hypothetical protein [Bacteriophage sp.]
MKTIFNYIKNHKIISAIAAVLLGVSGYLYASGNDNNQAAMPPAPFQIMAYSQRDLLNQPYVRLQVTSTADIITINSITVNRGNCLFENHTLPGYNSPPALPATMRYGQNNRFVFFRCDKALEATISTNVGTWTVQFSYPPQ